MPDSAEKGFHSVDVASFTLTPSKAPLPLLPLLPLTPGAASPRRLELSATASAAADAVAAAAAPVAPVAPVVAPVIVPVNAAAILDTGTNVLLLPPALLSALGGAMCADASLAKCAALWANQCVALTAAEVDAYLKL